jgi:hypothetical protein
MRGLPTHDIAFPGDGWFVFGVLLVIVLIFMRMYVWEDRSGRRTAHRSKRRPRTSNGIQTTTEPGCQKSDHQT